MMSVTLELVLWTAVDAAKQRAEQNGCKQLLLSLWLHLSSAACQLHMLSADILPAAAALPLPLPCSLSRP
jgi:hypothetical protein